MFFVRILGLSVGRYVLLLVGLCGVVVFGGCGMFGLFVGVVVWCCVWWCWVVFCFLGGVHGFLVFCVVVVVVCCGWVLVFYVDFVVVILVVVVAWVGVGVCEACFYLRVHWSVFC